MMDDTASATVHGTANAGNEPFKYSGDISHVDHPLVTRNDGSKPTPLPKPLEDLAVQDATSAAPSEAGTPGPDSGEGAGAAPYGTRSRNRTGGARPNYADDKELDQMIEATGKTSSKSAPGKAAAPPSHVADNFEPTNHERSSGPIQQRGFAAINNDATAQNGITIAVKDALPGMSSFNANPAPPAPAPALSKKRKQPGSNITTTPNTVNTSTIPKSRPQTIHLPRQHIETNMMTFEGCGARLDSSKALRADDGTTLSINDHAYFICEPPGEPYYLARIMEFLGSSAEPGAPIDAVRVNWYYRPKDIQRKVQDTRVVFASMHSDTCPLTSLRGKCNIQHFSDIPDLDEYRKKKDSFWFDKLFDRYIHRYYEVIPTNKVINVPNRVKKVLDERWNFVLVEIGRGKELTSAVKTCKKCSAYAANYDSVDCAICKNTYHMSCTRPPLAKKPARGFAWACAACSRAQELRLEARHTPNLADGTGGDEDMPEGEDEDEAMRDIETRSTSADPDETHHQPPTAEQVAQANLWPYRYLGIHCRVEDALDYDDRIYPRASSRLGPRHQANVTVWHGQPVELVKPSEIKKKYIKSASHKKDAKLSRETIVMLEADKESKLKRPKWVMDEPLGYIARGEDQPVDVGKGKQENTARLLFKMPDASLFSSRGGDDSDLAPPNREKLVDDYMRRVKRMASSYNLPDFSTNFLTKAIERLQDNHYDVEKALTAMKGLHLRSDLKEPDLNKEEVKRFEEGVLKYGNELHNVARHVGGNMKEARIVRYYYLWKKTERGKQVWGAYEGRRNRKNDKKLEEIKSRDGNSVKLVDDVADDHDDSAFDNDKAADKTRGFRCKFCETTNSRQWRRAPGTAPGTLVPKDSASKNSKDKSAWLTVALCGKCAYLWRRYAIQYESIEEVSKKIAAAGGRASKRRIDEELMRTIVEAQEQSGDTISTSTAAVAASAGVEVPSTIVQSQEAPKKKAKTDKDPQNATPEAVPERKKIVPEKPPEPAPLKPEPPRVKTLACAVCEIIDLPGDELLNCRDCRLAVHRSCYGVSADRISKKWLCDMCSNDRATMVSTTYECILCPVKYTAHELMEPPKISHKKKTDREREKERKEKEMVEEAVRLYRQQQEAAGRPANPREALKRTAWNNWIHVTCAIWTPEMKFGDAALLDSAEGVGFIPPDRFGQQCKVCRQENFDFPTVKCHAIACTVRFHIGCAHQEGYLFGLDIGATPKGTRRDVVTTMKLGEENGAATPAILCPAHQNQPLHHILEQTEAGVTALQLYVRTFKQVDQSITGTVRRAAQFAQILAAPAFTALAGNRRASTINGVSSTGQVRGAGRSARESPVGSPTITGEELHAEPESMMRYGDTAKSNKKCYNCKTLFSPKWWPVERQPRRQLIEMNGGPYGQPMLNGVGSEEHRNPPVINPVLPPGAPLPLPGEGLDGRAVSPSMAKSPLVNGATNIEQSSGRLIDIKGADQAEEQLWQCHKCHVEKRSPPPLSPQVHPPPLFRPAELPSAPYSGMDGPIPAHASIYQPSHHPWAAPTYSMAQHSHPVGPHAPAPMPWYAPRPPPPPPPLQHQPWDGTIQHQPWMGEQRNGMPSPSHNGPMYRPPPPPPPANYGSYSPIHAHGPHPFPATPHTNGEITSPLYGGPPHANGEPGRLSPSILNLPGIPRPPPGLYHTSPPPHEARAGALTSPQSSYGPPRPFPPPPAQPEQPPSHSREPSRDGTARPATPAESERPTNYPDITGASQSPSLRNLLS